MSGLAKRILITLVLLSIPPVVGLLITYEVIKVDWVSFMEVQPSYRPMEAPLPLPERSVPVDGAAYLPGAGAPENPVEASLASLERGQFLYQINCTPCHGASGRGDGPVAESLKRKPADLTGLYVVAMSDGDIFLIISNGLQTVTGFKGGMPALRENLRPGDRWDVVNLVRSLQGQ